MNRYAVAAFAAVMSVVIAGSSWCADAPKIGVIHFTALVNGYKRMVDEQDASIKRRDQIRLEETAKNDEINRLTAKLQQHKPDSEAYTKTEDELRQKKAELQVWRIVTGDVVMAKETRIIRDIFLEVEAAAAEYGKKNGYALILKEDELDISKAGMDEVKAKVALRKVIYSDSSLDITDALIKLMNDKYDARKKEAKGAGEGK